MIGLRKAALATSVLLIMQPLGVLARVIPAAGEETRYAVVAAGEPLAWQGKLKLEKPGNYTVRVRVPFTIEQPQKAPLIATADRDMSGWFIDGTAIPLPVARMRYRTVSGVALPLEPGVHMLEATWTVTVAKDDTGKPVAVEPSADLKIREQVASDLAITTGPVICQATTNSFTVTCRTTVPAAVDLQVGQKHFSAGPGAGLMHTIKADGLGPDQAQQYLLTASAGDAKVQAGPFTMRTMPDGNETVFAATGDSRTQPKIWGEICAAILKHQPRFVLHTGDLIADGRVDALWDESFWIPARDMVATVPFYPIMGNHEQDVELFDHVFALEKVGQRNWTQQIGPVLLIAIDGKDKGWKPDGPATTWLEANLKSATAPYIFLITHYPALSSSSHGSDPAAKNVILPLLAKYKATAMIAGHDHCYERSEPEGGPTTITAGGGGAPLYEASKANPDSKVFKSVYNYVIFTANAQECTMHAYSIDGTEIDSRTWPAVKR